MIRLRRFSLVASIVVCGSMALAAAVGAAGGSQPSSELTFSDVTANASVGLAKGVPPGQPGFSLFASRSSQSFETGKSTTSTQVFLVVSDGTTTTAACFVIPARDFKVGENLQSASLHTTLTATSPQCPGKGGPVGVKPGSIPLAGGGGGTLPLPISIDVSWVGNGIVSTSHDSHSFECLDYSTRFSNSTRGTNANASGNMSAFPGPFNTPAASVTTDQSHQESSGILPQGCFGGG
jgi:hypothetical protein